MIEEEADKPIATATSGPVLGVKISPLLNCIGVDRYVCSVLHLLVGLANDVLNNLFIYVNERSGVEGVRDDVNLTSIAVMDAHLEYTSFITTLVAWDQLNGGQLTTLHLSKSQLSEWLYQPRTILSSDQRPEARNASNKEVYNYRN
jgi:hypothetical protein